MVNVKQPAPHKYARLVAQGSKGRSANYILVPKDYMNALSISPGDMLEIRISKGCLVYRKVA